MTFIIIYYAIFVIIFLPMGISYIRSGSQYIKNLQNQGKKASLFHNFSFIQGICCLSLLVILSLIAVSSQMESSQSYRPYDMPALASAVSLLGLITIFMGIMLPYLTYLAVYKQSEEVGEQAKKWKRETAPEIIASGPVLILMGAAFILMGVSMVSQAFFLPLLIAVLTLIGLALAALIGIVVWHVYATLKRRNRDMAQWQRYSKN